MKINLASDGRWLTALTLGALVVVPQAIGGFNRKTSKEKSKTEARRRNTEPLPPVRNLLRAVERRDHALERIALKIPVLQ